MNEDNWNKYCEYVNEYSRELSESIKSIDENIYDESLMINHLEELTDHSHETIITSDEDLKSLTSDESSGDDDFCLTVLRVSDFDIKLHQYLYPIPEDPGLVPGFWVLYPKPPSYEQDGVDKFKDLVRVMKLQSIQRIPEMLQNDKIDLKYYGVNPKIMRAICEAMFNNTSVKTLDLEDNWLTVDACYHLNELLVNNQVLSSLNLSGCRIGPRGAKRIQEGIGDAPALEHLDVSRCDLGDEGVNYITTGVYYSSVLQTINLRDNKLGNGSGIPLEKMLTQNDSLKELNLSWNSLCTNEFWQKFVIGLGRNVNLTHLDLSWNSLGKECSILLAEYLSSSTSLREINLKGNRFETEEAAQIAEALMKNTTLEVLHLENNPIKDAGAYAIIKSVTPRASPRSQLRLLDLGNIWASKNVVPLMKEIKNERPLLKIILGGILSNYEISEPDPRKVFLKRANFVAMKPKKKKKQKNFGQFILSLEDSIIPRETFEKLVKRYKIKLSKSLVTEIMNAFAIGEDAVDQSALKKFYLKEYPNTHPAPLKPKKKKIKKKKKKIIKKKSLNPKSQSEK